MTIPALRDWRFWTLLLAFLLLIASLVTPRIEQERDTYSLLAVVDITGSMNVQDYSIGGLPATRLDMVKASLVAALRQMPCQSKLGLAVFTDRRPFLLFQPIEICENFDPLEKAINELDWRMAWQGDSRISAGFYRALDLAKSASADLVMFTDGQEAPPLPYNGRPEFEGEKGTIRSILVGVGGHNLSPIPKYDDFGRQEGFYGQGDVPQETRIGAPPPGAEKRPGWHPRNAPWGDPIKGGQEHLSSVHEEHLSDLADETGTDYLYLSGPDVLAPAVKAHATPHLVETMVDVSAYLAGSSLLFLIASFLNFTKRARRSSKRSTRHA